MTDVILQQLTQAQAENPPQSERDFAAIAAIKKARSTVSKITRSLSIAATVPVDFTRIADVSAWTTITDGAAARVGLDGAIVRARDGIRDDQRLSINRVWAAPLRFRGFYAFLNPRPEADDGGKQALDFWNLIKFWEREIPPVLDLENSPNMTMPTRTDYIHRLLYPAVMSLADSCGRRPLLYSNLSFFRDYLLAAADEPGSQYDELKNKQWLRDCEIWIAYPATAPKIPSAWDRFALWQYALDVTTHTGLSVCDYSRPAGTAAQFAAWCKDESYPLPVYGTPSPDPDPDHEDPPAGDYVTRAEFDAFLAEYARHTHSTGGPNE